LMFFFSLFFIALSKYVNYNYNVQLHCNEIYPVPLALISILSSPNIPWIPAGICEPARQPFPSIPVGARAPGELSRIPMPEVYPSGIPWDLGNGIQR
jgi:hypothetical protein